MQGMPGRHPNRQLTGPPKTKKLFFKSHFSYIFVHHNGRLKNDQRNLPDIVYVPFLLQQLLLLLILVVYPPCIFRHFFR
jgi:hypothetical protein